MKLNKKVFAGALALAMGLGVVAPAANSFAANESAHPGFTEEYATATKKYNAALKALREQEKVVEKAKADKEAAFEAYKKAVEDANNTAEALEAANAAKEEVADENTAVKAYAEAVGKEGELDTADKVIAHYKTYEDKDDDGIYELYKAVTKAKELHSKAVEAQEANNKAKDEKAKAKETLANATKTLKDELEVLGEDKGDESTELYEAYYSAKKEALKAGVNKAIIEKAEEKGEFIEVPGEEEEEPEATEYEKIEKAYKQLTIKLESLKFIKENLKETYKRYQEIFDKAEMAAEKALKDAKDYLDANKPMAFNLVNVAFADEEEKSADEILNQLEEADKLVDDALSKVEEDSKEQNDKDDADKKDEADEKEEEEDEETEGTKEDEETEGTKEDDKPVVEEKEDVKPANNVKTGVAGVAGVGAVLAAASAAYVSSKRK